MSFRKYLLYCNTEGVHHTVWSLNQPTRCPVDEGHAINTISISDVSPNENVIRIASLTNTSEWTTVFQTINKASMPLEFLKCIYSLEDGTGSIRLYNITTPATLTISSPLTATTGPAIYNFPVIENSPVNDEIVGLQIMKAGGTGSLILETVFLSTS